jgi:hypothetical protein
MYRMVGRYLSYPTLLAIEDADQQDPTTGRITDLVSFYSLPSSIMKHAKHDVLNAAYMFYYATDAAFEEGYTYAGEEAEPGPSTSGSRNGKGSAGAHERARLGERLNGLVGDMMVVAKNVRTCLHAYGDRMGWKVAPRSLDKCDGDGVNDRRMS